MGLAELVQKAAQTAFVVIGNIKKACTYTSKGTSTYDPSTGSYTSSDTAYTGLDFLFEDYSSEEMQDSNILKTDQKISIPQLNLTPTPKVQDTITDPDGVVWGIEGIGKDPARALWVFQGRNP